MDNQHIVTIEKPSRADSSFDFLEYVKINNTKPHPMVIKLDFKIGIKSFSRIDITKQCAKKR